MDKAAVLAMVKALAASVEKSDDPQRELAKFAAKLVLPKLSSTSGGMIKVEGCQHALYASREQARWIGEHGAYIAEWAQAHWDELASPEDRAKRRAAAGSKDPEGGVAVNDVQAAMAALQQVVQAAS